MSGPVQCPPLDVVVESPAYPSRVKDGDTGLPSSPSDGSMRNGTVTNLRWSGGVWRRGVGPSGTRRRTLCRLDPEVPKGRIKEAVGALADDPELRLEGEVERKQDDAELATRGWSQPKAHVPAAEEAQEAQLKAERAAREHST